MFSSLPILVASVIGTSIAIHLGTRAFIGTRADGLPGGAGGFALIQSMAHMNAAWAPSIWFLVPLLLVCAGSGHLVSVRLCQMLSSSSSSSSDKT